MASGVRPIFFATPPICMGTAPVDESTPWSIVQSQAVDFIDATGKAYQANGAPLKSLSRRQNTGSEVGITLADKSQGDCNALVKSLSGESLRIDDVAQFVLRVPLWRRRDSFIQLALHRFLQFVVHVGSPFLSAPSISLSWELTRPHRGAQGLQIPPVPPEFTSRHRPGSCKDDATLESEWFRPWLYPGGDAARASRCRLSAGCERRRRRYGRRKTRTTREQSGPKRLIQACLQLLLPLSAPHG